ncbi:hypothetical protein AGMMS4956_12010 [Bacteroidia bacterium]|nr:hypothetical protein AGMMS4956_12010 [Bacteroidia bacterium]
MDGNVVIDDIYTDLLPNNGILNRVNLPRTTILVGRKGTGKSTIFQKSQKEIDKNKKNLSIYIDVKTLYDNSTPKLPTEIEKLPESIELIKYLMYSNFVKEIILKTKSRLKNRIEKNYIVNVLGLSELFLEDVSFELNNIEEQINSVFEKLDSTLITSFKNSISSKMGNKDTAGIEVSTEKGISGTIATGEIVEKSIKKEFDNTLITFLNIKKCFIDNIIKIRDILKIKTLFIYLDDFSEIGKYEQTLFMDWFIAPVNNLSEDFVKFKIATYPKRFYYGKLDNAKIDELSLDFFDAFSNIEKKMGVTDISKMEMLALDYTERLLRNRFKVYFPNNSWEDLFEITPQKLYEILFISTMNIPRKMGFILSYCYESCLIHNTKIGLAAIENATLRYYTDVVEKYFLVNEFVCKPFDDKITNDHQYELLNEIIKQQIKSKEYLFLQKNKDKDTSHFFVSEDLVYLLDNLELNGFISTYNKVKDDKNIFSTIYCLDLGLCKRFNLLYGKPRVAKSNSHTLPPLFNFNSLIMDYFNSTQVIRCTQGHEFQYSQFEEFKRFSMNCPKCLENNKMSKCIVTPKFEDIKQQFKEREDKEKIRISFLEYMILNLLKTLQNSASYEKLSSTLDFAISSISKTVDTMVSDGLLEIDIEVSKKFNRDFVKITSKGVRKVEKIDKIIENSRIKEL